MKAIRATYDGTQFQLDEAVDIPANSRVIIVVMSQDEEDWYTLAHRSLNRAYGDDEPEYGLSQLKELNEGNIVLIKT